jgi:hypothetical protein
MPGGPSFPGYGDKKHAPPLPPKYLQVQNADGNTETIENPAREQAEAKKASKPARNHVQNPNMPKHLELVQRGRTPYVHTEFTTAPPKKDFSAPAHRFKAAVDSKSEFKGASGNMGKLRSQLEGADYSHIMQTQDLNSIGTNIYKDDAKGTARGGSKSARQAPPEYFGSSYTHMPNAAKKGLMQHHKPPARPQVPRPYIPPDSHFFKNQEQMANRAITGDILGQKQPSYVDPTRVPHLEEDYLSNMQAQQEREMPTADNPVVAYDAEGVWSACWDDSAEAVYYYNNITGEATWIPPDV